MELTTEQKVTILRSYIFGEKTAEDLRMEHNLSLEGIEAILTDKELIPLV